MSKVRVRADESGGPKMTESERIHVMAHGLELKLLAWVPDLRSYVGKRGFNRSGRAYFLTGRHGLLYSSASFFSRGVTISEPPEFFMAARGLDARFVWQAGSRRIVSDNL